MRGSHCFCEACEALTQKPGFNPLSFSGPLFLLCGEGGAGRLCGDKPELRFASSGAHHSQHLWSQALQVLLVPGRDRLILTVTTEGEEGVEGEAARALGNGDTVMLVHALTGDSPVPVHNSGDSCCSSCAMSGLHVASSILVIAPKGATTFKRLREVH